MAVAAGTVTLSEMKCITRIGPHIHLYTKLVSKVNLGERGYFDTGLFYNTEEFTMRSNEQHKMLLEGSSFDKGDSTVYRARLDNDELSIDLQHEPGQLCYTITLLTPDATLTVGPKTSLSLLLKSAQLHVTTYILTEELVNQLKSPRQEHDQVPSQVDADYLAAQRWEEIDWQVYHKKWPDVSREFWYKHIYAKRRFKLVVRPKPTIERTNYEAYHKKCPGVTRDYWEKKIRVKPYDEWVKANRFRRTLLIEYPSPTIPAASPK